VTPCAIRTNQWIIPANVAGLIARLFTPSIPAATRLAALQLTQQFARPALGAEPYLGGLALGVDDERQRILNRAPNPARDPSLALTRRALAVAARLEWGVRLLALPRCHEHARA
jgi:hypothetical protein